MNPAIINILIAGLFFGAINLLVKFYSHIPALEIVFFRSLVSFCASSVTLKKLNIKIFPIQSRWLFIRGISGAIALSLYFTTIHHLPLGAAVTLLYLAPIFTVIWSIFVNKEIPSWTQLPFLITALIGAALVKGFSAQVNGLYFFMGIAAALFAGLAYSSIRKLNGVAHHQLIIFYFPALTLPLVGPYVYLNWKPLSMNDFIGVLLIGIFTHIAQIFMTKAYMQEKATNISHFNYLTCVYALLAGVFIFGETPSVQGLVGISIIITSVILQTRLSN